MALQVVTVPNPPAGTDWTYTIPGIYLEDVIAVYATLTPGSVGTTDALDYSGNMFNLPYNNPNVTFHVAGYVSGDTMVQWNNAAVGFIASGPFDGTFFNAEDFWTNLWTDAQITAGSGPGMWTYGGSTVSRVTFELLPFAGPTLQLHLFWTNIGGTFGGALSNGNIPFGAHMYSARYDSLADKVQFYVDGAPYGTPVANSGSPPNIDATGTLRIGGAPQAGDMPHYDEVALGGGSTDDAEYAQLFTDRGNFAAYSVDQASMSPNGYYHLDEPIAGHGDQVLLEVTDGTHTVLDAPTGFAESTSAGPFTYAWLPDLASSVNGPGGTLLTVAIPELVLPPGYTIGTRTLDLGASDQWSGITVWWDRATQDIFGSVSDYLYPPGLYYVYQQEGAPA